MQKINQYDFKKSESESYQTGVIIVSEENKEARLMCPCGCGDFIRLCLIEGVHPSWKLDFEKKKISPSIRRLVGCLSHFTIISNGVVMWN